MIPLAMKSQPLGVVFITGGTGSFGRALIAHILKNNLASRIVSVSRNAEMRYRLEQDFAAAVASGSLIVAPADVRDITDLRCSYEGDIETVFHAAAEKHITTGETHGHYVNSINVNGAHNVWQFATERKASKFVALSTDKACEPVNAYGKSKADAEQFFVRAGAIVIRYGNVVGSSGSVIPLFLRQIDSGKRITVTSRDMTRFFMPLSPDSQFTVEQHRVGHKLVTPVLSAVELAIYAANHGRPGEIIVPKIPSSTVGDLADAVARLNVSEVVEVVEVGVRPGEKMHEMLISSSEAGRTTYREHVGVYVVRPNHYADINAGDSWLGDQWAYTSNNNPQPISVIRA